MKFAFPGSDVLSGSVLGVTICVIIVYGVSDLFDKQPQVESDLPISRQSTSQIIVPTIVRE